MSLISNSGCNGKNAYHGAGLATGAFHIFGANFETKTAGASEALADNNPTGNNRYGRRFHDCIYD
jgi:hypothetical protein